MKVKLSDTAKQTNTLLSVRASFFCKVFFTCFWPDGELTSSASHRLLGFIGKEDGTMTPVTESLRHSVRKRLIIAERSRLPCQSYCPPNIVLSGARRRRKQLL